jgi:cellulose synthase/poly-beta-1,6-N-acetylglucosamine synthase-like glycosyltransferase
MLLLILFLVLWILYGLLMIRCWQAWQSIPVFNPAPKEATITISVVIPVRNEEATIGDLLKALQEQSYPAHRFEVIVVDDHSTDRTADIVKNFPDVRLIRLETDPINSYKKKAIETGIAAATGELIVTTDADCHPPTAWLATLAAFKEEKNAVFIAAPVVMQYNSSLLQVFQAMDFMVLQGITGATVHTKTLSMCNGANLAYERKAFYEVNGFSGIDRIASGDDMLLMHKIRRQYPEGVYYLKSDSAIVSTTPMTTWKHFFNQRIRWASKARYYDDKKIFPVLLLVYLFNLSFLALVVAGFFHSCYWMYLAAGWVVKTLAELPFFISVARFFDKRWMVKFFFLFQPLHIIYTIITGLLGQTGSYEWKGRRVK